MAASLPSLYLEVGMNQMWANRRVIVALEAEVYPPDMDILVESSKCRWFHVTSGCSRIVADVGIGGKDGLANVSKGGEQSREVWTGLQWQREDAIM